MYDLWPHQNFAIDRTLTALREGERRVCVTSPTGGGKSSIICELIKFWVQANHKVVLYTNRKLLIEQLSRVLGEQGIEHGVRAAGHRDDRERPVQVSSIQTEEARVYKRELGSWALHPATRIVCDEAHLNAGPTAAKIFTDHLEADPRAALVGVTATPIGINHVYSHLIQAGTTSELRRCGALVPAVHYGPDEPDLKHVGRFRVGEDLTEKQNVKAIMVPGIFGRVYEWWKRLNPDGKPTILFAPGVKESIWFAEQFVKNGVSSAHIDGEDVWVNGVSEPTSRKAREEVLEGSRTGNIKVICNRFVMREGIDCPWLEHGILATVFGSLQSFLQSGGRLMRSSKDTGKVSAIIQDHGGSWHKHGSLNADREWFLDRSGLMLSGLREDRLRNREEPEPVRCPQCGMILMRLSCPCGYEIPPGRKSRPVIQADGSLRLHDGDIYPAKIRKVKPSTAGEWAKCYYAGKHSGMTFRQVEGYFFQKFGYFPQHTQPLMPKDVLGWYLKVESVPRSQLI